MRLSNCIHEIPPFALCGICESEELNSIIKKINRPWNNIDGPCPYCKTNGPCKHWFGCGWSNSPTKMMEEKMNEIDFVKSVQTLEVRENDLIVIKIEQKISMERSERIKKMVEDNLPAEMKGKIKVFILEEGTDIEILRSEKMEGI